MIKNNYPLFITIVLLLTGTNIFAQAIPDTELKTNVQPLTSALQRILQLQPSSYEFNTQKYTQLQLSQGRHYGFVAEHVQSVFPELVEQRTVSYMFGKNAFRQASVKSVNEAGLVPLLVASIKEQQQQIEELRAVAEELKKKMH